MHRRHGALELCQRLFDISLRHDQRRRDAHDVGPRHEDEQTLCQRRLENFPGAPAKRLGKDPADQQALPADFGKHRVLLVDTSQTVLDQRAPRFDATQNLGRVNDIQHRRRDRAAERIAAVRAAVRSNREAMDMISGKIS